MSFGIGIGIEHCPRRQLQILRRELDNVSAHLVGLDSIVTDTAIDRRAMFLGRIPIIIWAHFVFVLTAPTSVILIPASLTLRSNSLNFVAPSLSVETLLIARRACLVTSYTKSSKTLAKPIPPMRPPTATP